MTEIPRYVLSQRSQTFRQTDEHDDAQRPFLEHHSTVDSNGSLRMVYPSRAVWLGTMLMEGSDDPVPVIRTDYAFGATTLAYLPTEAELRMLGEEMLRMADGMKAAADDLLARTLAKKGGAS